LIEDAQYAQRALIDETALRRLTGDERNTRELNPLQLGKFKSDDAGEELVRRIERSLEQARTERVLFAIFGRCWIWALCAASRGKAMKRAPGFAKLLIKASTSRKPAARQTTRRSSSRQTLGVRGRNKYHR
jgi:type VI protein secretion system component VasF